MNTRILFVDDEPGILEGLRHTLRRQRHQWDMVFVGGGDAALAEFDKAPFDVIVSDMRMPGMDGATLLTHVRQRHPRTTRIVLSGHSEQEAVVRALPVAHQFLSKPLDPARLLDVIAKASGLNTILQDERLRAVIGRLDKLPSVPKVYQQLTHAMADPDVTIADVVAIVTQDPAMGVKVLQLANSSYFGLPQRMSSLHQAVTYLGVELLKGLALGSGIFSMKEGIDADGTSLDGIQQHSLMMAQLMRRFLPDPKLAEAGFTAALVHDAGSIVLAAGLPDLYREVTRAANSAGVPCHVVERDLIGVTHAEMGAYLLGMWGLPFGIVEAVAHHHHPGKCTPASGELLAALHVADALVYAACSASPAGAPGTDIDHAFLEQVGCAARLPQWTAIAGAQLAVLAP